MAMSAVHALQTFRSCTALLSSRTLVKSAAMNCPTRLVFSGRRHYSEKSTADAEEAKKETKEDTTVLTPEQEKLKVKEAEVIDLTVRVINIKKNKHTRALHFYHRAVSGIFKQTF